MLPGPHVVLVTVPGTHDVELVGEVVAEAAPLGVEPLGDAIHQGALAHRTSGMHALVFPGNQLAVEPEDPDLHAGYVDDHAPSLEHVFDECGNDGFGHGGTVLLRAHNFN